MPDAGDQNTTEGPPCIHSPREAPRIVLNANLSGPQCKAFYGFQLLWDEAHPGSQSSAAPSTHPGFAPPPGTDALPHLSGAPDSPSPQDLACSSSALTSPQVSVLEGILTITTTKTYWVLTNARGTAKFSKRGISLKNPIR